MVEAINSPQASVVTLSSNYLMPANDGCDVSCKMISATDVSTEHRDDVLSKTVDADDGGVGVLVLDEGGNGTDADAHRSDEDESIMLSPFLADVCTLDFLGFQLLFQYGGNLVSSLTNCYNSYLLHRNIVIG